MALSHLLDTSVYSQPLKPKPLPSVQERWDALGDEALAISVICEAELLYGLELRQSRKLQALYEHLLKDRLFLFPVDAAIVKSFAQIKAASKRKGHVCADFDFLIAATARVHRLIVATINYSHFASIDGLAVEDWSKD